MGLADPWIGSPGLSMDFFFFFCFFNFITEAGSETALVKATINHDLASEAVAKTVLVNAFCLPP